MATSSALRIPNRIVARPVVAGHPYPITCMVFGGVAAVLLVIPPRMFANWPREVVVWSTFAVLLAAAISGFGTARRVGLNPWVAPVSIMTLIYFLRFGAGALVAEYWERYPWVAFPEMRWNFHRFGVWDNLPRACQILMIFACGMLIGSTLAVSRARAPKTGFSKYFSEMQLKNMLVIYAPIAVFINSVLQFVLPINSRFIVTVFGSAIYPIAMLGAFWLFSANTGAERSRWTMFLLLVCGGSVPVGLTTGQVGGMLLPILMIPLGYMIAKGRPPWKSIAIALPVLFFIVLPFTSVYKFGAVRSQMAKGFTDRIAEAAVRFAAIGQEARFELSLERLIMRFAGVNMPALYSRYYPDVYPFELGETFAIEGSALVPRILWPQKPIASNQLNTYPERMGILVNDGHTTALFDAPSEYYINFGVIGMLLLAVAHGYYWQELHKWLGSITTPLLGSVIVLTLTSMNEDFYGIGLLFMSHVKTIPVWLLTFYCLSRRRQVNG